MGRPRQLTRIIGLTVACALPFAIIEGALRLIGRRPIFSTDPGLAGIAYVGTRLKHAGMHWDKEPGHPTATAVCTPG